MPHRPTIFVCTPYGDPQWRWLAPHFADAPLDWSFHVRQPRGFLQRHVHTPDLALIAACRHCAKSVIAADNALLVTLDPRATYWCARFAAKHPIKHIAYGFNFASLPSGLKRRSMAQAFSRVNRFIVYSNFERDLYSKHFDLPAASFEMKHWGVAVPETGDTAKYLPTDIGEYICALGGNRRDYPTLMAAMRSLPNIRCVAIMRPGNAKGLDVPPNVTVLTDIPFQDAMAILARSRFMALPLEDAQTPCGHVTIVAGMRLGKATIVTHSAGIADYVINGRTGLTCEPADPASLAAMIRQLWDDPDRTNAMGVHAREFAATHCTEQSMADHFRGLLQQSGLLRPGERVMA